MRTDLHGLSITYKLFLCLFSALTVIDAQSPEIAVLGGSCEPRKELDRSWQDLVTRHRQAERSSDREATLTLAKEIVRGNCDSDYWWFKLAANYLDLNRPADAVATLEALRARGANAIHWRLDKPDPATRRILATPEYRNSPLARQLAADRQARDRRLARARARLAALPHPPEDYVAKQACPFECCGFGTWTVSKDTPLYDRPFGTREVGRAPQGTKVLGVTGEVHLRPAPVLVRLPDPEGFTAKPADVVYVLDYTGEGYGRIWQDGKIVDGFIAGASEICLFPEKETCWGEYINAEDAPRDRARLGRGTWWVKIKTPAGVTGWTRETGNFAGIDRCG